MLAAMRGAWILGIVLALPAWAAAQDASGEANEASAEDASVGEANEAAEEATPGDTAVAEDAHLDAAARSLFLAGRDAYNEGRFEVALENFERAFEISGRPALLFNIGQTLDRLRRDREAIEVFERFLEADVLPDQRSAIERRLEILRADVAEDTAPSPEEVARRDQDRERDSAPPPAEEEPGGPRVGLIVGIVVAVVAVAALVAIPLALRDPSPDYQGGTSGEVHYALGRF